MSGERQAVCARRVVVRRPKGVGRGVGWARRQGIDDRKSIAEKQVHEKRGSFKQNESGGTGAVRNLRDQPFNFPRAWAGPQCCSCSTEARLRHNNDISQYNEYTLVLRYNILFISQYSVYISGALRAAPLRCPAGRGAWDKLCPLRRGWPWPHGAQTNCWYPSIEVACDL